MRKDVESLGFAKRLVDLMQARGLTGRGRARVDIGALATAADTSYEMARRYAEGLALPRPEKLAAISKWLGVDSATLLWGEQSRDARPASTAPPVAASEVQRLEQCLEATLEAARLSGRPLTAKQIAEIASSLVGESKGGAIPTAETIARLLSIK